MAAYPKIPTIYNNHGATKNIQCPDKPLRCKAFRASFTVSAAGYITPRNSAQRGNLPLGQRLAAVQPVAQPDDVRLPLAQTAVHAPAHLGAGVPDVQLLQHVVVHADHVHQGQRIALSIGVQAVGQGNLPLQFPLGAKIHQYLICYALLTAPHLPLLSICHALMSHSRFRPAFQGTRIHNQLQTGQHERPCRPK